VTWLLCDYGQVLSQPQAPSAVEMLQELCGMGPDAFREAYWADREAYDRGDLDARGFWTAVIGDDPGDRLEALVAADIAGWVHLDPRSLAGVERASERGLRPAILSNAPREVGLAVDGLPELATFHPRLFSWALGVIKPEPAIYLRTLELLEAEPADVVFVDDRPVNVAAARALGIRAVDYTGPGVWETISPVRG
jgi:putative hydrolase of the HAD superfamily